MSITDQASEDLEPSAGLRDAVHRFRATSFDGMRERMFTLLFKGLVYPQIWEDPAADLKALELKPGASLVAIASGGCNILSYLTADPAAILAVDLNRAHVALTEMKLAAIQQLPSHELFFRFFGEADARANIAAYRHFLRRSLRDDTRRYWDGRGLTGRRRISLFARRIYRHGLLGRFIGASHLMARLHGANPSKLLDARSLAEQQTIFETVLAPVFDRPLVRWLTSKKISLYGLGIPPAQYEALAQSGDGDMASVLRARLKRLACAFPLNENYFAWQAFARSYPAGGNGPLPPYLCRENYETIRTRAQRVEVLRSAVTEALKRRAPASFDAYLLLDAQDWMTDTQLQALWDEITRTARPGARVVFRTAAKPTLLPGRVDPRTLRRWTYEAERSKALTAEDRSCIYGGLHIYRFDA